MCRTFKFPDIHQELKSEQYEAECERNLDILNSFLHVMVFIQLNCSRSDRLKNKLFCLCIIDDLIQSLVAIKSLSAESIRNPCRRELRYMIESTIKACLISQKNSDKSIEEQILEYRQVIKSTNVSMIKEIEFYFFPDSQKEQFIEKTLRLYGKLCAYVHSTPHQMQERIELDKKGRYIGYEGADELCELNNELGDALLSILVLFFHTIPRWCVGDYLVEPNGYTVSSYYCKYRFFAIIDEAFDYKHERQDKLQEIKTIRDANVCYQILCSTLA